MQQMNVLALSCTTLNPSWRNRYNIWNWGIKPCFSIQDHFDHILTIHENTFNHVKRKFINIHFNDFLVRVSSLNLGVMIFWKISCVHVKTLLMQTQSNINFLTLKVKLLLFIFKLLYECKQFLYFFYSLRYHWRKTDKLKKGCNKNVLIIIKLGYERGCVCS